MKSRGILVTIIVVVLVVVGAIVFLGHRSQTADDSAVRQTDQPAANEQGGSAVTISDMAFSPSTVTVKKGTTVTWTNQDSVAHSVVSDTDSPNGGLNSSTFAKGAQFSFNFTGAGTYKYHCGVHPSMTGTVVVTE